MHHSVVRVLSANAGLSQRSGQRTCLNSRIQDLCAAGGPALVQAAMVPTAPPPAGGPSSSVPPYPPSCVPGKGQLGAALKGSGSSPDCLEAVRDSLRRQGVP